MEKDILLALAGLLVGSINAVAGGGMLIGFPVLVALGIPPLVANATGNVITAPGQLSSAFAYRNYLRRVPARYCLLLLPIALGAASGALTLRHTSADDFAELVPVLVLFGVLLFAFQPLLHFHLHRHITQRLQSWLPLVLIGIALLPLSFYGGYFGAGYGFMMMAFLGFTNLPDAHMINGMKNISAVVVASTSVICLYSTHLIDWRAGASMALGTTIGGYFGARSAQKVSSHQLRLAVISIGLIAVAYLGSQRY